MARHTETGLSRGTTARRPDRAAAAYAAGLTARMKRQVLAVGAAIAVGHQKSLRKAARKHLTARLAGRRTDDGRISGLVQRPYRFKVPAIEKSGDKTIHAEASSGPAHSHMTA